MQSIQPGKKEIKVCAGPGCKAWSSQRVIEEFRKAGLGKNRVCSVPCMRKCGGGVSVQFAESRELLKLRHPERIWEILKPGSETSVCA